MTDKKQLDGEVFYPTPEVVAQARVKDWDAFAKIAPSPRLFGHRTLCYGAPSGAIPRPFSRAERTADHDRQDLARR